MGMLSDRMCGDDSMEDSNPQSYFHNTENEGSDFDDGNPQSYFHDDD